MNRMFLVLVILAVLALLAWLSWRPTSDPKPPAAGGAVQVSAGPPIVISSEPNVPAVDAMPGASDLDRLPVLPSTGPGCAHVLCVWADDATPAVGISIRVFRRENGKFVGPVALLATDKTGSATFDALVPCEYEFFIMRHRERAVIDAGVCTEIRVAVKSVEDIRGRVVDGGNQPLATAEVATEVEGIPVTVAITGDDGRFKARLATAGGIWARKEGYVPCPLQGVKGIVGEIVLRLEAAAGSLRGVVLDPDHRAVAHATIAIGIDLVGGDGPRQPPVLLESDDRGEFATTQVPRAACAVFAYADGFAFGEENVDINSAGEQSVVVRLRRLTVVRGTAFGGASGNEPLSGAAIDVHRLRDLSGLLSGMSDNLTRTQTVTDRDGRYGIRVPPGRTWIIARSGGRSAFHNALLRDGEAHEWNPDLSLPAGVIRGSLQGPDGTPLVGWSVTAERDDPIDMHRERADAKTGDEGHFELGHLRRLPHTLTVVGPDRGEIVATRADVHPDQPAFVWRLSGLPSQSGAIVGTVLANDCLSVDGGECTARCDGATRTGPLAASGGSFRVERVFPGTWHVIGKVKAYGTFDLGRYQVLPDKTVDIGTYHLPAPGVAVVRVSGRGFEATGVALAIEQVGDLGNRTSEFTIDHGALRSSALPPGAYRVLARGHNFAPITRDVTILAGADVAVDIDVDRAAAVTMEFVPEELGGREWRDYLQIEIRSARGELVCRHRRIVAGAPSATLIVGLAEGSYEIDAWAKQDIYRRGGTDFVVRSAESGPHQVKVMLRVQGR